MDTTKEKKLGTEFAFDVSSGLEKDKILEFMADPKVRL